jgi:LysM repeat protein
MVRRVLAVALLFWVLPSPAASQSLRGSAASLDIQNLVAQQHNFTYLETSADVSRFVDGGFLVHLGGNSNYDLADVSFPYARPEVQLFIERLSEQYRAACGEKLVVTSLTRPKDRQPANASPRSVHPTGMAVDLRLSQKTACRSWLERTLLSLEGSGVLNATRETNPPHYHVAVFPQQYAAYVSKLEGGAQLAASTAPVPAPRTAAPTAAQASTSTAVLASARSTASQATHRVARGESLWTIAQRYGTTVQALQRANNLSSSRIVVGQTLRLPGSVSSGPTQVATSYQVARGDTLWTIAQRHGTTIDAIRQTNNLNSNRIYAGQVLKLPVTN